ncbi:MAG: nucleotide exchange factor GrpE [Pseudomonadota bacterium]|nr:nucleotide exchange factor GrpE [Pseudomonadota bacterium]
MAGDQQEQQYDAQDQAGTGDPGAQPAEVDDLAERIQEAVTAALAEQRDMVLRAQAEIQNMRRRCEADVEKAHKFALEKFSAELLTVVDNLERALNAVGERGSEQVSALAEGVELTLKSFLEILNKFNVQQVNPVGEPFDPQVHQAITTVVNPNVEPNTVLDVMQKGYTLHGRVIRPAMVVVSKTA